METELYNNYVERWKTWKKRENEYYTKRAEFIREGKDYLLDDLEKEYGHDGFNSIQFGPTTLITNPKDLLNHNFILPGIDLPFCELENTDRNIPYYFGKTLISELRENLKGIVTGYCYDATDDYIQIRLENGNPRLIMVNSKYKVLE